MGGSCSIHGGDEKCMQERDHFEDLDIDGRIMLKLS
jgi:hypothetical protein